jgi:hypothetical protein
MFHYFVYLNYLAYMKSVRFVLRTTSLRACGRANAKTSPREFHALGVGYRKTLRDGWVRYLEEKHAGSGGAPILRRARHAVAERIVLDDNE